MDVTALPFNRLIGLEPADPGTGFLVSLPGGPQYTNHLGTVHAAVLLAVAEAGSGAFLAQTFGDRAGYVPVVRRLEAKFRAPARGRVSARASAGPGAPVSAMTDLAAKGRALIRVAVEVVDEGGTLAMTAAVEWFIAKAAAAPNHPDDATTEEMGRFQGTWRQTAWEKDGVVRHPDEHGWDPRVTFAGDTFVVTLADGTVPIKGTFTLDPTREPKAMDLTDTFGEDAGKTFLAIYALEDDRLVFCAADAGRERPTAFRAGPGQVLRVNLRETP